MLETLRVPCLLSEFMVLSDLFELLQRHYISRQKANLISVNLLLHYTPISQKAKSILLTAHRYAFQRFILP